MFATCCSGSLEMNELSLCDIPCTAFANVVFSLGSLAVVAPACRAIHTKTFRSKLLPALAQRQVRAHLPAVREAGSSMTPLPSHLRGKKPRPEDWPEINDAVDKLNKSACFAQFAAEQLQAFFYASDAAMLTSLRASFSLVLHRGTLSMDPNVCDVVRQFGSDICEVVSRIDAVLGPVECLRRLLPEPAIFRRWAQFLRRWIVDYQAVVVSHEHFSECVHRLKWLMHWQRAFEQIRKDLEQTSAELRKLRKYAGKFFVGLQDANRDNATLCHEVLAQVQTRGCLSRPQDISEMLPGGDSRCVRTQPQPKEACGRVRARSL